MKRPPINRVLANLIQHLGKLTVIVLLLTVPTAASDGWAGKSLQLDGEVVRVEVVRDRQSQIFRLRVKLKFTNTGEKPVILLLGTYREKTEWWVLDTTVSRTLTDASDGKPFYISPTSPANSKTLPLWKELRRQLSSSQPPSTLTETIQPQGTFFKEIETTVVIHDDEGVSPRTRVWLKVFLELWPDNIEPSKSDEQSKPYGESLRRKWQASGDLQLEPILSSPIPFDLPAQPSP